MALFKPSFNDLEALRKEIEVQGDILDQERLQHRAEIDRMTLELEAMRVALQSISPDFKERFDRAYEQILQSYNPETRETKSNHERPSTLEVEEHALGAGE